MTRAISAAGLELVERNEGLRLDAYLDVAKVLTIGFGHTGPDVRRGQHITEEEARALLRRDLAHAEAAVDASTHDVPTSEAQFSAMVSLAFNIGAAAFRGSSLLKDHRAQQYQRAGDAFLQWSHAHVNGRLAMVPGLLRRRAEERALYLGRELK